ncbi:hypothetical protein [Sphingopyxis sp. P1IMeth2]|uniref:hypothetical protein n=1 Tax=Sphingopyxis sp. P1IMeth2 TaxID=1892848 RepID=UPI0016493EE5|nr:hypothetical protein [Sphingopyxis sp. P1IMeth2]
MSDNIDTRVAADLHPGVVKALDSYDEDTETILGPTVAAFTEAYTGIGRVHDAKEKAATNPTWNEARQLIETDAFGQKVFAQIAKRFDSAASNLKVVIAGIEKEFSSPIESKAAGMIAAEIRSHVKGLKIGERLAFVQAAIKDGDQRTATAILGAPSYLSGLDRDMQATLTRIYHEHHEPVKAKRLRAAQAGLDLLESRGGAVHTQLAKAVGCIEVRNDRGIVTRRILAKELKDKKSAAEQAFVLDA